MTAVGEFVVKPRQVQALRLDVYKNLQEVLSWTGGNYIEEDISTDYTEVYRAVHIPELPKHLRLLDGEWVLKSHATGKFSILSDEEFASTYQQVGMRGENPFPKASR